MRRAMRVYGWLLKLYPARFREEYEPALERQFQDEYRDVTSPGEAVRLWSGALWDLATSVPRQIFSEMTMDIRQGMRAYQRRSFSMTLAVIALALAIGASTGIFSVMNALLLRSLPFARPERLVELWLSPVNAFAGRTGFNSWWQHSAYLNEATTFSTSEMNLAANQEAWRVKGTESSANFFHVLGVDAIAGRTFAHDEEITGHNSVAVIGYGLWQQLFGGDPAAIGKTVHVNGQQFTVIGVMPANFNYPGKTQVWMPTIFDFEIIPHRGAFLIETVGRLRNEGAFRQAQEMFKAEALRKNPKAYDGNEAQNWPKLVSLQNQLAGPVRQQSWVLAGMALLVLLTACANVAQLVLSRATERSQELAVRAALGASRARLLQQLITEAVLLTTVSTVLGLGLAQWICRLATSIVPPELATQEYTIFDWRVFGFAAGLAILAGVVFGLSSAHLTARLQPAANSLRTQRAAPDAGLKRARAVLIVIQAAITLCLVTSSFALGHAFLKLLGTDLGFRTGNVVTLNVSLQGTTHSGKGEWAYYSNVLSRLRAMPEVEAASAVSYLPLANQIYMANSFKLDSGQSVARVVTNAVMPDYFGVMGTDFLSGHDFEQASGKDADQRVIVNETFARLSGLGRAIVGRHVLSPWRDASYVVEGVAKTARLNGPDNQGGPQIYFYIGEETPPVLTLVAKVRGDAAVGLAKCRDAVRGIDPQVPIYDVKTMDERLDDVLARPRFYVGATALLSLMTGLLAMVGIYGTTSYALEQRRREMGIRMAVGATPRRLRGMMIWESAQPLLVGVAGGMALAIFAGRFLEDLLVTVARPGFGTCLGGGAVLVGVGLLAAWQATSLVRRIDPMEALRSD